MAVYTVYRGINMDKNKQVFTSKSALADYLGITRKTLYKRAKERKIELSGSYTQDQLDTLRSRLDTTQVNENISTNTQDNNQKDTPDTQLVNTLKDQIANLQQQLKEKKDEIKYLKLENEEKNRQIERRDKALDQQQHLQLTTSQQLKDAKLLETIQPEKKKRWWQI